MRKSEKTRIVLIIMTVICLIFLAGSVFLMMSGIRINSRIEKVSQNTESLQKELDTIQEQEKEEKTQIEKLQKKSSAFSDEDDESN